MSAGVPALSIWRRVLRFLGAAAAFLAGGLADLFRFWRAPPGDAPGCPLGAAGAPGGEEPVARALEERDREIARLEGAEAALEGRVRAGVEEKVEAARAKERIDLERARSDPAALLDEIVRGADGKPGG